MPTPPKESPVISEAQYSAGVGEAKKQLADQKKFTVYLQQPHGSKPEQCTHKDAHLNGLFYRLRYGKPITVPESVYMLLVQSGDVMPQREEDARFMPTTDPQVHAWRETIDN
jgi:hypothetical protein